MTVSADVWKTCITPRLVLMVEPETLSEAITPNEPSEEMSMSVGEYVPVDMFPAPAMLDSV